MNSFWYHIDALSWPCAKTMSVLLKDQSHGVLTRVTSTETLEQLTAHFPFLSFTSCWMWKELRCVLHTEGEKHILFVQAISRSFKYIIQTLFNFNSEVETRLRNMPSDGSFVCWWTWKQGEGRTQYGTFDYETKIRQKALQDHIQTRNKNWRVEQNVSCAERQQQPGGQHASRGSRLEVKWGGRGGADVPGRK